MKHLSFNNNHIKATVAVSLLCCFSLLHTPAIGADYSISSSTIDGGGGTSSGGQYVIMGTIAQPDAAYSTEDDYELLGGFWPGEPLCIVNFQHFAVFAEYWLEMGADLPADLYKDEYDIVDFLDLDVFGGKWLGYCPYDWPLK